MMLISMFAQYQIDYLYLLIKCKPIVNTLDIRLQAWAQIAN